jgi:transporter family protein
MDDMQWLIPAIFSAVFAALTAILAKIGIRGIDSNLATAIRTSVILIFAWGIVLVQGSAKTLPEISRQSWIFLVLSGIATGLSWLFYFRALQIGEAQKVVPIDKLSLVLTIVFAGLFLREKVSMQTVLGAVMMTGGAIVIAMAK